MGSPIAHQRLHKGQDRDSCRIGAHDAGAEGDGNNEVPGFQQGFFLVGKAAFGTYQNGGWRPKRFQAFQGIVIEHGLIAVDQ